MSRKRMCNVCIDGLGFVARPCPGKNCYRQKPLDAKMSELYGWPIGTILTPPMLKDSLREWYPKAVIR